MSLCRARRGWDPGRGDLLALAVTCRTSRACVAQEEVACEPRAGGFQGAIRVYLLEAEKLAPKDNFLGLGGKSDPYAKVSIGLQHFRSRTVYRNLSPTWNEVFEVRAPWPLLAPAGPSRLRWGSFWSREGGPCSPSIPQGRGNARTGGLHVPHRSLLTGPRGTAIPKARACQGSQRECVSHDVLRDVRFTSHHSPRVQNASSPFQFMVYEVPGQDLEVDLYDEDPDRDDFLGR